MEECHTNDDSASFESRCRSLPLLYCIWHIAKGLMDSDGLDHTRASGGSTQDSPDSLCHWTQGALHVHTVFKLARPPPAGRLKPAGSRAFIRFTSALPCSARLERAMARAPTLRPPSGAMRKQRFIEHCVRTITWLSIFAGSLADMNGPTRE